MMKRNILLTLGLIAVVLIGFNSCSKRDLSTGTGTLKLLVTDAPLPIANIDEASVTITKVEIRQKNHEGEHPFITLLEDTTIDLNLLDLRNGVTSEMAEMDVPAGNYDLIRLYVDHASITVNGVTYNLKVPSGAQTGIKVFIDPDLNVESGLTADLLLDFNLERSFIMKGNMNTPVGIKGFIFKPVIRAVNKSTAGTVQGTVSDTSAVTLENAEVWINADTTIATAFTDADGFYALPGITAGTYTVYATKENYDTVMKSDVEVLPANKTVVDFELTPAAGE